MKGNRKPYFYVYCVLYHPRPLIEFCFFCSNLISIGRDPIYFYITSSGSREGKRWPQWLIVPSQGNHIFILVPLVHLCFGQRKHNAAVPGALTVVRKHQATWSSSLSYQYIMTLPVSYIDKLLICTMQNNRILTIHCPSCSRQENWPESQSRSRPPKAYKLFSKVTRKNVFCMRHAHWIFQWFW